MSSTTTMEAQISADAPTPTGKKQKGARGHRMGKEQDLAAKAQFIVSMQEGHSWQLSATKAELQISQSSAYRLWGAFRQRGETALSDGRHGHPIKLRGEHEPFSKNSVSKLLKHLPPPSRWNCKSVLTCM